MRRRRESTRNTVIFNIYPTAPIHHYVAPWERAIDHPDGTRSHTSRTLCGIVYAHVHWNPSTPWRDPAHTITDTTIRHTWLPEDNADRLGPLCARCERSDR